MTRTIRKILEGLGFIVCPSCRGEGEVEYFCGHSTTTQCYNCGGNGVVKSLNKQKQSKSCVICKGREGGCGGCNSHPKGLIEWETFELVEASDIPELKS